jgi:beta-lactamase class A
MGSLRWPSGWWLGLALVLVLVLGFAWWRSSSSSDFPTQAVNERSRLPSRLGLDVEGRVALEFETPAAASTPVSLPQVVETFRGLPGQVGVLVLEDGRERATVNPDAVLAVGSGFKLAVLAALQEQIAAGVRDWHEVVELQPGWKSMQLSTLADWPDGAPVTLHTLATLMIALSDNSAADALIDIVGRDAVEAKAPHTRPFLTTREAFVLRNPDRPLLLARYRASSEAERRALLAETVDAPLPDPAGFAQWPVLLDVEWSFSARELCALAEQVAENPIMQITPGLANPSDWARVAFKGGADRGVLSYTTWLQGRDGRRYCAAAIWNHDATLDGRRLSQLYGQLLSALR